MMKLSTFWVLWSRKLFVFALGFILLGQTTGLSQVQVEFQPLVAKRTGENLFDSVYRSWKSVPFRSNRVFVFYQDGCFYTQKELCIVRFEKGERVFYQKVLKTADTNPQKRRYVGFPVAGDLPDLNVGFRHNYRDFRIYDVQLARKNYFIIPLGRGIVCGREALLFRLEPKKMGLSFFIKVDRLSGSILAAYRFDSDGVFQSAVVCENFEIGNFPLPKGGKFWKPRRKIKKVRDVLAGFAKIGFPLRHLPLAPNTFRLLEAHSSADNLAGTSWLTLLYTDGVVPQFILFGKRSGASLDYGKQARGFSIKNLQRGSFVQISESQGGYSVLYVGLKNGKKMLPKLFLSIFR